MSKKEQESSNPALKNRSSEGQGIGLGLWRLYYTKTGLIVVVTVLYQNRVDSCCRSVSSVAWMDSMDMVQASPFGLCIRSLIVVYMDGVGLGIKVQSKTSTTLFRKGLCDLSIYIF